MEYVTGYVTHYVIVYQDLYKVKLFFVIIFFSKCNGMICFFFLRISILLFFYFHRYWNIVRHYTPYSLSNKTLVAKMDVFLFISSQNSTRQLNCVNLCNFIQAFPFEINLRKKKNGLWYLSIGFPQKSVNFFFPKRLNKYHRLLQKLFENYMGQCIQEWSKQHLRKTDFKKFEWIWCA